MEDGVPDDIAVTVTFLEMHAPPAYSPPVPLQPPGRAAEDHATFRCISIAT